MAAGWQSDTDGRCTWAAFCDENTDTQKKEEAEREREWNRHLSFLSSPKDKYDRIPSIHLVRSSHSFKDARTCVSAHLLLPFEVFFSSSSSSSSFLTFCYIFLFIFIKCLCRYSFSVLLAQLMECIRTILFSYFSTVEFSEPLHLYSLPPTFGSISFDKWKRKRRRRSSLCTLETISGGKRNQHCARWRATRRTMRHAYRINMRDHSSAAHICCWIGVVRERKKKRGTGDRVEWLTERCSTVPCALIN